MKKKAKYNLKRPPKTLGELIHLRGYSIIGFRAVLKIPYEQREFMRICGRRKHELLSYNTLITTDFWINAMAKKLEVTPEFIKSLIIKPKDNGRKTANP